MNITVREYVKDDIPDMIRIWNQVVVEGKAFPQVETLTPAAGAEFFSSQTRCGVAADTDSGKVYGLYILHPNNIGRCGHICNASYAVDAAVRGEHIGEKLVLDCLDKAPGYGYRVLQFNAVVKSNIHARHLYSRLGFTEVGTIPGGFRMDDGHYEDICVYYHEL